MLSYVCKKKSHYDRDFGLTRLIKKCHKRCEVDRLSTDGTQSPKLNSNSKSTADYAKPIKKENARFGISDNISIFDVYSRYSSQFIFDYINQICLENIDQSNFITINMIEESDDADHDNSNTNNFMIEVNVRYDNNIDYINVHC